MHHYPHHIGDYRAHTSHLTMAEDGCYRRLLDLCYMTERALPADIAAVQRLAGARDRQERVAVETILREFFTLQSDGWRQGRVAREVSEYQARADQARKIGRGGGRPKTQRKPTDNPSGSLSDTGTEPSGKLTVNREPLTGNQSEEESGKPPRTPKPEKADGKFKLPADWRPDLACRAYAQDRGLDPDATADVFVDHFTNRKGKSEQRTADGWRKRWEIWCRTDAERTGPLGGRPARAVQPPRGNEAFYDRLAALSDRSRAERGEMGDGRPVEGAEAALPDEAWHAPR